MADKDALGDRSFYRRYEECGFVYGASEGSRVRPEVDLFRDWVPQGARVLDLVETKAAGKKPKVVAFRPKKQKDDQLADALEASLAGVKTKRKAHG